MEQQYTVTINETGTWIQRSLSEQYLAPDTARYHYAKFAYKVGVVVECWAAHDDAARRIAYDILRLFNDYYTWHLVVNVSGVVHVSNGIVVR
jgi:hypothetical protein